MIDKLVLEQLIDVMPADLRIWLCEWKPGTVTEAGSLADNYMSARRRRHLDHQKQMGRSVGLQEKRPGGAMRANKLATLQ